jgi:hypothetical protein
MTAENPPLSKPEKPATVTGAAGRSRRPQLTLAAGPEAAPRVQKAKTSGRVQAEIWEEVRDCVVWHGHTLTIDGFTERAFREHLKRLRQEYGLGDRFPARRHEPKQGRRVS